MVGWIPVCVDEDWSKRMLLVFIREPCRFDELNAFVASTKRAACVSDWEKIDDMV